MSTSGATFGPTNHKDGTGTKRSPKKRSPKSPKAKQTTKPFSPDNTSKRGIRRNCWHIIKTTSLDGNTESLNKQMKDYYADNCVAFHKKELDSCTKKEAKESMKEVKDRKPLLYCQGYRNGAEHLLKTSGTRQSTSS